MVRSKSRITVLLTTVALALPVVVAPAAPAGAVPAASPVREAARPAAGAEGAALAAAKAQDTPVEVPGRTTETTKVTAQPDGRLTLESSATPQRVARPGGTWEDLDLTLHRAADGTLRPAAATADVRFSGGGAAPLAGVYENGKSLTLTWPDALPEPAVSGDTATYAGVLPDVDLAVRATATGFTHVLVIKTRAAAANTRIDELRLTIGGDATVVTQPGGGLQAVTADGVLATAEPAAMWDSSLPREARLPGHTEPALSTPQEPGDYAATAPVTSTVEGDDLVLRPDPAMLDAPPEKFPLYVDPSWSTGKKRWAYSTSDNGNNTDTSVARVGKDPESSKRYRSFFEFPTAALKGKYIRSAYVQMEIKHSASCDETWTHMYATGAIASTPRTKWSPKLSTWLAATASAAPKGDGCDTKNDEPVNFRDDGDKLVTGKIAAIARAGSSTVTIGFCACNADGGYETDWKRWKKFYPNKAKLIVDYSSYPAKPVKLAVAGVACSSGKVSVGTPEPTLTATYPDADQSKNQTLTASYEWVEVPSGGITGSTPRRSAPDPKSVPAGSTTTSGKLTGAVKNKTYAIRTRATDPPPYGISGEWSAWCQFTVDTDVPAAPTITVLTSPTLPGTSAVVRLTSTNKDAARFYYGWDDMPLAWVAATGSTTKTATVTLTAARYGDLTFTAHVSDITQNVGNQAKHTFEVGRPSDAVARWSLESYPTSAEDPLADLKPAVGGDTPLVWDAAATDHQALADGRLIGGESTSFDATAGGTGAYLTAANVPIDTSKSFSATAWARLEDGDAPQTVVSKDGGKVSAFRLMYRSDSKAWCAAMRPHDEINLVAPLACAPASLTKVGKWTHLGFVYDDSELRMKLYVDGKPAASYLFPDSLRSDWGSGWNATGPIAVGRAKDTKLTPSTVDQFRGQIADVQIFDRALVDQDFVGQRKSDEHSNGFDEPGLVQPVRVGRWDFRSLGWCYAAGVPNTCRATDAGGFSRFLTTMPGTESGEGVTDAALVMDGVHWAPEGDPLAGTATREYGYTQRNTQPEGTPPVLANAPVLRTDQPFTVAAWVRLDDDDTDQTVLSQDHAGAGYSGFDLGYRAADKKWIFSMRDASTISTADSYAVTPADDPTTWHQLVGVYDPGFGRLRLYVDGEPAATGTFHSGYVPWQANGPLVIGRSDQPGGFNKWLSGSVDNVDAWQGVSTDTMIGLRFEAENPAVGGGE